MSGNTQGAEWRGFRESGAGLIAHCERNFLTLTFLAIKPIFVSKPHFVFSRGNAISFHDWWLYLKMLTWLWMIAWRPDCLDEVSQHGFFSVLMFSWTCETSSRFMVTVQNSSHLAKIRSETLDRTSEGTLVVWGNHVSQNAFLTT